MASMFQPSKTLKEIRKQLKHLNQQYREECKIQEIDNTSERNSTSSEQSNFTGFPKKKAQEEEKSLDALENKPKFEPLNIQTFLEEACECPVDLSEHVESVITAMMENLEDNPLAATSQELCQPNTIREGEEEECSIEQVAPLLGDVINSVEIDSSYDEDIQCIEEAVACTISKVNQKPSVGAMDNSPLNDTLPNVTFLSKKEEQLWRKERIRKDNHNIIERRRRYNINDRIQELAALLPPTVHPSMKLHKGSILKASVEYIRELKKDTSRLISFESKRKTMETKYQKMMIKLFQLELEIKLFELNEETHIQQNTKKRPKRNHPEFDAMVEGMMKNTLQQSKSPEKLSRLSFDKLAASNSESEGKKTVPPPKKISRNPIKTRFSKNSNKSNSSTLPSGRATKLQMKSPKRSSSLTCEEYIVIDEKNYPENQQLEYHGEQLEMVYMIPKQTDTLSNEQEDFSKHHLSSTSELDSEQCNLLLDLFGSGHVSLFQSETQPCSTVSSVSSIVQSEEDFSSPILSPVTQTTNMFEGLLRPCDRTSSSSESHSLESSIESSGTH
ncbi:uncharacterized protein LOC134245247 [Saccostrea cucullata]|uniref:uncharacterized protein LOC134245247 n=1 Tax=Saccostrea cuccullata TaxID=36930 RepID=UPI002ED31833